MTSIPFGDSRWTTLNPPSPSSAKDSTPTPSEDGKELRWKTVGETDWWRIPDADRHSGLVYGFEHTFEADKGFEISVELDVKPKVQTWVKTGLEFEDDKLWAGVVVSSPFSDWSLLPPPPSGPNRFTISLVGRHLRVFLNGDMIRQVNAFGPNDDIKDSRYKKAFVGVMACSPKTGGAEVHFSHFDLEERARE
ncbi:hypothetical protein IAT40_000712 [Kwoniella sp. CBS 6097]